MNSIQVPTRETGIQGLETLLLPPRVSTILTQEAPRHCSVGYGHDTCSHKHNSNILINWFLYYIKYHIQKEGGGILLRLAIASSSSK